MPWLRKEHPNDVSQVQNYSRITREVTPKLLAVVKQQATGAPAPVPFVVQLGDLVEGLCGSEPLAERQAGDALDLVRTTEFPAPFLFTKGNHDEQWDKVVRSGLRDLFHQVDVVREKDQAAYADAARRLGVRPEHAWMIGNSPKSDIMPARGAGFGAVFVPHPGTWALELADLPETHDPGILHVEKFAELRNIF